MNRTPADWPRHPTRMTGFTLVELLIALALVAVISLLLFSGLRLGGRAWEAVESRSDAVAELRLARQFLERSLRQARNQQLPWDMQLWPVFSGDSQWLEWVAPLSEHVGIPGLYVLRLTLEDGGEQNRLVLTRWLSHPDLLAGGDGVPAWEPLAQQGAGRHDEDFERDLAAGGYGRTLLLSEVTHFKLAYFGVPDGEHEPDWFDSWQEQVALPLRVRIELDTPRQVWPASVVPLPGSGVLDATD